MTEKIILEPFSRPTRREQVIRRLRQYIERFLTEVADVAASRRHGRQQDLTSHCDIQHLLVQPPLLEHQKPKEI